MAYPEANVQVWTGGIGRWIGDGTPADQGVVFEISAGLTVTAID